jgi:glycosyltransferase involved in cell wall biosynthesis
MSNGAVPAATSGTKGAGRAPFHVLILPSELYCPPRLPLHGIFQRHQAEVLASRGIRTGVASFGYIPWRFLLSAFSYPACETVKGVTSLRHFARPVVPARAAYIALRERYLSRFLELVESYMERFGRPDVVHAHNTLYAGLVAARVRRKWGIPFVLTEHSSAFEAESATRWNTAQVSDCLGEASVVSAVGTAIGRKVAARVPTGTECVRLWNVLDPAIEEEARRGSPEGGRNGGALSFLSIGNLLPVKNHSLLLRAFAKAFRNDPDVKLRIGGDGPLRRALEKEALELGLSRQVKFLGALGTGQVVRELKHCDVFALSSASETFGVVLIEAMAFGRPVISTRSGGPEEIVDERSGLLVPHERDALAEGLTQMRTAAFDPEAIRERCLESWGADAFYRRATELYEKVIERDRGPTGRGFALGVKAAGSGGGAPAEGRPSR